MQCGLIFAFAAVLAGAAPALGQEDYSFEPSEFQKQPFEWGGYAEGKLEWLGLDRNAAFYQLNRPRGSRPSVDERAAGALEVWAKYQAGMGTLNLTAHGDSVRDVVFGNDHNTKLYEGGLSLQPATGLSFYVGKKTLLWGKGYAWNPVGFVQRPKDPTDPNLSREGFWVATADYTHSLDAGPLKTLGLTSVFIPTTPAVNNDFGRVHHDDFAAKLYALVGHTDIDVMALTGGAKGTRYGADFSTALTSAFELHGEIARITQSKRLVLNRAGQPSPIVNDVTSYLVGFNYLARTNTTFIFEYYHNGEGFQDGEGEAFYAVAHQGFARFRAAGNGTLLQQAATVSPAYMRPNPMRRYVNLRISQSEPFDIVYFTPSVTVQANLTDRSFLVLPELLYTGFKNLELRLRVQANFGPHLTEFGERQASTRIEFRARYFF